MPQGGTLEINSRRIGKYFEIVFADTGVGMTKETLSKIFTPLFTTKSQGMGFGLPICKRIVEAHGGLIDVSSEIGKGTKFTVRIPIGDKKQLMAQSKPYPPLFNILLEQFSINSDLPPIGLCIVLLLVSKYVG